MSSTASNYDVLRLYIGIGISGIAFLALLPMLRGILGYNASSLWMIVIAILYSVMMFASSYVEEEQQFWYWVTSGWFAWLGFKS